QIVPAAQVDNLALILVFAALGSPAAVHPQRDGHIVLAVLTGLALGVGDGAARQQVSDLVFDNHDISSLSLVLPVGNGVKDDLAALGGVPCSALNRFKGGVYFGLVRAGGSDVRSEEHTSE